MKAWLVEKLKCLLAIGENKKGKLSGVAFSFNRVVWLYCLWNEHTANTINLVPKIQRAESCRNMVTQYETKKIISV